MEQEIQIREDEIQQISINSITPQTISLSNISLENIDVKQRKNQNVNIEENENQIIYIDNSGMIVNITDVLVNGVSVVSNNIAYITVPTKTSELINDSGFITKEIDPTVPIYVKQISINDISNWNNKQNLLVSGTNIKTINNNSILGGGNINIAEYEAGTGIDITSHVISNTITSYEDLEDLPTIPTKTSQLINDSNYVIEGDLSEVALTGSYDDLSDKPFIPTETNDLINNSGFIDKDVNDLTYYTLSSSLSTVATTGNYNDLTNKPTIPTKTSDLNNDSGFISKNVNDLTYYTLSSNLSSVATSGNYNDLSNKPTIPVVNDGILTIQKNGTNIDSFSANSSTNKSINITVPTNTSDLNNDSGFITNNYITYSTSETRIGTWINGKPVYRKVIETTTPSTTSVAVLGSVSNLGIVTNLYGLLKASGQQVPLNFIYNTSDIHSLYTEGNNIMCKINDSGYLSKTCFVVIEYTKTTD